MQTQFNELTDAQWAIVSAYLPLRKRKTDLRIILNAILWINRTGCQWRNLDSKYPYWQLVYYYFNTWTKVGIIDYINISLVKIERVRQGKLDEASANTIDSQSVKIAPFIPDDKGIDGNKKVNGRKRHLLTDTLGLVIALVVTAANSHDGITGCVLFKRAIHKLKHTKCVFADHSYRGQFQELMDKNEIKLEIAARPESAKGFVPVKKRWVVERTFGWMNFFRRLAKDNERTVQNSESMIYLAQIQIILNRLSVLAN